LDEYDLVVIGGGTGGYTAAIRATQLGLTAALIERDKVGGTCLHRGCVPTKAWLYSAEMLRNVQHAKTFGVMAGDATVDYSMLKQRQATVVETLHKAVRSTVQKHKIEIIEGGGKIVSPTEVSAGERRIKCRFIIVATGSQPKQIPGLETDGDKFLNSDHLLALETPPKSIAIIGAGAIGCEFASFFADIGTQVTLVEMLDSVVPLEDKDCGRVVQKALTERGVNVMTGANLLAKQTKSYNGVVELAVEHAGETKQVRAEKVLIAAGRECVSGGLGLENTKAQVERGWVKVDETYRTDEPNVYAIGDAIGGLLLAHVAGAEGHIAAEAIAGKEPTPLDYMKVPRVTYCHPQVATVGLTEAQAKERGRNVKSQRFSLKNNAMALIQGETDGFAKVVFDQDSGDLLGVHLVGAHVSELISEAALARFLEASAWELGTSVHPHPTLSEALGDAAQLSAGISIYW
jgi:dihydrolipoamide dehydrogenase